MKKCPICEYPTTGGICKNCQKRIVSTAEFVRYYHIKKKEKKKLPN